MRNFFERFTLGGAPQDRGESAPLSASERDAIHLRADIRRREQQLNVDALNVQLPGSTDAMKVSYDAILARIRREMSGAGDPVKDSPDTLLQKADEHADLFPVLAGYYAARAAQARLDAGADPAKELTAARMYCAQEKEMPKTSPANLLPDAVILGIEKSITQTKTLPASETIAQRASGDKQLLADYALVLDEKDRAAFMAAIPENQQRDVSALLDASVSRVLHQALIAKGEPDAKSPEEAQRTEVRRRLFAELKVTTEKKNPDDRHLAGLLAEAMVHLGEDTRQLLLEIIRDEAEGGDDEATRARCGHLPRVIKVFLDEFDDWKGNDVILRLAGDQRLNHHLAIYLFGKLVDKGYIPKDVGEWWDENVKQDASVTKKKRKKNEMDPREERRLEILQRVVTDLGVVPSKEIAAFIADDKQWKKSPEIADRIAEIRAKKEQFDSYTDVRSLVAHLHNDKHAGMIYYLLHGGDDRFNLINNYPVKQFQEVLGLIADLREHEKPIAMFDAALAKGGVGKNKRAAVIERLRAGHYPLPNPEQAYQEVSFDVSENAAIKNANGEIGRVLGKNELGVALAFPMEREFLSADGSEEAQQLLQRMNGAHTFTDRAALMADIEKQYPDFRERVKATLEDNWKILGEKMLLEATLQNVLFEERVPIRGEELLPRLDTKRLDLKRMKKDLLVALRGGNERAAKVAAEIARKKKAFGNLTQGLERAKPDVHARLTAQIVAIEQDLQNLERERTLIANMKVEERFAHLSPEERKAEIENLGNEIIALTEKSPSAIFTYITMQVLGEERLTESDVMLIRELESHLQGPFQTIQDTLTYQKPVARGETVKRQRVGLRWVDKRERLMHMARFADSKICCFSSNNYEMIIGDYGVKNEYWVASVTADPLSFVISMELPESVPSSSDRPSPRENLGFIFGNFSVNDEGKLAVLSNGIYYAPGIENEKQVAAILGGVELMLAGLPVATLATASQHGGSIKFPDGWTNEPVTLTRLRALDNGSGKPESKIYDDCGTGSALNRPHLYGEHVYHKQLKK